MAIQPAICNQCGGRINVDDVDLNGFCVCEFCKTPHKVIDVITIDGLPTVKSLIMTASMHIDDNNVEKAFTPETLDGYVKKILGNLKFKLGIELR